MCGALMNMVQTCDAGIRVRCGDSNVNGSPVGAQAESKEAAASMMAFMGQSVIGGNKAVPVQGAPKPQPQSKSKAKAKAKAKATGASPVGLQGAEGASEAETETPVSTAQTVNMWTGSLLRDVGAGRQTLLKLSGLDCSAEQRALWPI
jgi:hypothetical protein